MRSLVAQRRPFVNIPHVRVCPVGAVHHAWRTCTVSRPLPPGLWRRRRLRPPARTLALSCPTTEVKRGGISPVPAQQTLATRRGLLSAGCPRGQRLATFGRATPGTLPCWVWGVSATCTPPASRRFRQRFLASAEVTGPRAVHRVWLTDAALFFAGFGPQRLRTLERPRHRPQTVVHVWFFARTICCAVTGRTRTPAVSSCPEAGAQRPLEAVSFRVEPVVAHPAPPPSQV